MKKSILLLLPILLLAAASRVHAVSLGVYEDTLLGRMFQSDATWGRQVHDTGAAGAGIALQMPLRTVKDAGYRFNFGWDRVFVPRTTRLASDYDDSYRVNLSNLFNWTFYRKGLVGLWLGPQITLSVFSGRVFTAGGKHFRDLALVRGLSREEKFYILVRDSWNRSRSYADVTLSGAPVVGIDLSSDDMFTLTLDAGFRVGMDMNARRPGSAWRYEGYGEILFMHRIVPKSGAGK